MNRLHSAGEQEGQGRQQRHCVSGRMLGLLACAVLAAGLCGCSDKKDSADGAASPQPAAARSTEGAAAQADVATRHADWAMVAGIPLYGPGQRDTLTLYREACALCHDQGISGAPRRGDRAAWQQRLARGQDALLLGMVQGKGAMPPKGTLLDANEAELRALLAYLTGTDGAAR